MNATGAPQIRPRRRWLVPEVVQTSAMDCGPAALKAVLQGHGIPANLARLREACHTSVDGTSIATLQQLAIQLGLEAEEVLLPAEHLALPSAAALPALLVVQQPSGTLHFVVVWRVVGPWIELMDPARGRRWVRPAQLLREAYLHETQVALTDFAEWTGSDGFQDALTTRLRRLGLADGRSRIQRAHAQSPWAVGRLEAAVRTAEGLVSATHMGRGRTAGVVRQLSEGTDEPPDAMWIVRPASPDPDTGAERVTLRGAIALELRPADPAEAARSEAAAAAPANVRSVLTDAEARPGAELIDRLTSQGWPGLAAVAVGLVVAGTGAVVETLLLRGFMDLGGRLPVLQQRIGAVVALLAFSTALMLIDLPTQGALWNVGRKLEGGFRAAFLAKVGRLQHAYFASRPVSDMAVRAHTVHLLRQLPVLGGQAARAMIEIVVTVLGICWIDPASAPLALLLAGTAIGIPLLAQPWLVERDLRVREHGAALSRFHLDALLGLTAVRAHAAEAAVEQEHGERLREWARAAWRSARSATTVDAVRSLVGYALAAALVLRHLEHARGSGWGLLLVYWTMSLVPLGQEVSFLLQQQPVLRNATFRLLEPLLAPEESLRNSLGRAAPATGAPTGAAQLDLDDVVVEAAGQTLLTVPTLHLAAGSHVAVVGHSGAGKSTLAGLLLGFHRAASGTVRCDGISLEGGILRDLRRQTVWVDPGVSLWNRSLLDNLRYGAPQPDRPVGDALEAAELDQLLVRLPTGLQTPLGEGGGLVSGGEGQRVRLGRGITRGPARLVILDEAFRGLEEPRRRSMLAEARQRWRGATLLCMTHDVAHTLGFDRVLVIDGGRIVEDGSPAALEADRTSRYHALLGAERDSSSRFRQVAWRTIGVGGGTAAPGEPTHGPGDGRAPGVVA